MQYTESWLDLTTSLFRCPADNHHRARTFRQILFSDFGVPHDWFFRDPSGQWISGYSDDLATMIDIRTGKATPAEKTLIKQAIQCYTPSARYSCKKKGKEILEETLPILQLDFDNLQDYDLDEVKRAIFALPFVGYVGKSVSGNGLFALVLIAEPDKLREYAEHCFAIFNHYGLPPDTSKGRNYTDLRFVSYDCNALCREYPEPLRIKNYHKPRPKPAATVQRSRSVVTGSGLIAWGVREVSQAQPGTRFETVRRVAYTLGGHGTGLQEIKKAISHGQQYAGIESKYLTHADEAFQAGGLKPIER